MGDWGVKVSEAGTDVKDTSEAGLQLTSKYPVLKANKYGQVTTVANTWYQISHTVGAASPPLCAVWAKGDGNAFRFIAPRRIVGVDPVGGITVVRAYTTTSDLYIITSVASDVYYYIFVDPWD